MPKNKNIHISEELLTRLEGEARCQRKTIDELANEAVHDFLRRQKWPKDFFVETYGAFADHPIARESQPKFDCREALR